MSAAPKDDIVLVGVRVKIPPPPPPADSTLEVLEVKQFEVALVDAETEALLSVIPLNAVADITYAPARPLKCLHKPGVTIQIRETGADAPLYASPPLSELRAKAAAAQAEADQAKADGAASAPELAATAAELSGKAFLGMGGSLGGELELPLCGDAPPPEPAKGKGGKGAAVEEPTGASLTCESWRLQRALPAVGKPLPGGAVPISQRVMSAGAPYAGGERYRTRPLACRYSAPRDLVEFESRLNGWRAELSDNHKIASESWPPFAAAAAIKANPLPSAAPRSTVRGGLAGWPPRAWGEEWRAPYIPHHMHGDALTRASKDEYVNNCEAYRTSFNRQRATVLLEGLKERLPSCTTAEQGVQVLCEIRAFLEAEVEARAEHREALVKTRNLRQVDAAQLLKQLKHLRLPFELLVRSVWEEGPEVEYDRVKLGLETLLAGEVSRRKAAEEAAKRRAAALKAQEETGRDPALLRPKSGPSTRLGLLTFHGAHAERPPKKRFPHLSH